MTGARTGVGMTSMSIPENSGLAGAEGSYPENTRDTLFKSVDMQTSKATTLSRSVCFICLFIEIMNLCLEASPSITEP